MNAFKRMSRKYKALCVTYLLLGIFAIAIVVYLAVEYTLDFSAQNRDTARAPYNLKNLITKIAAQDIGDASLGDIKYQAFKMYTAMEESEMAFAHLSLPAMDLAMSTAFAPATDPDFYLRRNTSGEFDIAGTPFFDKDIKSLEGTPNIVIYGQSSDTLNGFGKIFDSDIVNFRESPAFIYFDGKLFVFQPLARFTTSTLEYLNAYPEDLRSIISTKTNIVPDRLLTLVTRQSDSDDSFTIAQYQLVKTYTSTEFAEN